MALNSIQRAIAGNLGIDESTFARALNARRTSTPDLFGVKEAIEGARGALGDTPGEGDPIDLVQSAVGAIQNFTADPDAPKAYENLVTAAAWLQAAIEQLLPAYANR